jgi:hypothetical protein
LKNEKVLESGGTLTLQEYELCHKRKKRKCILWNIIHESNKCTYSRRNWKAAQKEKDAYSIKRRNCILVREELYPLEEAEFI